MTYRFKNYSVNIQLAYVISKEANEGLFKNYSVNIQQVSKTPSISS